jgi:hypothetical protein
MENLALQPFPDSAENVVPEGIKIQAAVRRSGRVINISYRIQGHIDALSLPGPLISSRWKDFLWQQNCFELFLAGKDEVPYMEWNLSPDGSWNGYQFQGYRDGMKELKTEAPSITSARAEKLFIMDCSIELEQSFREKRMLQAGISAVIKSCTGHLSYWAVHHPPGNKADFHDRRGFTIELCNDN